MTCVFLSRNISSVLACFPFDYLHYVCVCVVVLWEY